jgi:hypothetical protein
LLLQRRNLGHVHDVMDRAAGLVELETAELVDREVAQRMSGSGLACHQYDAHRDQHANCGTANPDSRK